MLKPLNGEWTHPLSKHAMAGLRDIASNPAPRQTVNPGVCNRLLREGLVEETDLPSPFPTHAGRKINHLRVTTAGMARLRLADAAPEELSDG